MAKRRFTSKKSAESFAKKVNGELKDLREIKGSISKFIVKYDNSREASKKYRFDDCKNWAPEEGRDFGYPNEYWK